MAASGCICSYLALYVIISPYLAVSMRIWPSGVGGRICTYLAVSVRTWPYLAYLRFAGRTAKAQREIQVSPFAL